MDRAKKAFEEKRFREVVETCDTLLQRTPSSATEPDHAGQACHFFSSPREFMIVASVYQFVDSVLRAPLENLVWVTDIVAEAGFLRGYALIELGDYERAAQSMQQASSRQPSNPVYLLELGYCYERLGRHEQALSVFHLALQVCREIPFPELTGPLQRQKELADGLRASGDTELAEANHRMYQQHYDLLRWRHRTAEARALRGIGFQLIELRRLREAEAAFKESLEVEPGNPGALKELEVIRNMRTMKFSLVRGILDGSVTQQSLDSIEAEARAALHARPHDAPAEEALAAVAEARDVLKAKRASEDDGGACPKCGGSRYREFRLGGKMVHRCVDCGCQDY